MSIGTEDRDAAVVSDVVGYLETITQAYALWHKSVDAPPWRRPVEALILEIGQIWTPQPLPIGIKQGMPKRCFRNARLLASRRQTVRYVEGFALGPNSPLPVPHAWAVDTVGGVIDPTWEDPGRSAYYGVVIPLPVLRTMIDLCDQEGFFGSDYRIGFPTLKLGRIPTVDELRAAAVEYTGRPSRS